MINDAVRFVHDIAWYVRCEIAANQARRQWLNEHRCETLGFLFPEKTDG